MLVNKLQVVSRGGGANLQVVSRGGGANLQVVSRGGGVIKLRFDIPVQDVFGIDNAPIVVSMTTKYIFSHRLSQWQYGWHMVVFMKRIFYNLLMET